MIKMVLGNLRGHSGRSILCVLAVMVSVYLNGTTATMNNRMYDAMTSELARYMGRIYVQQAGSGYPPFDSSVDETTAESILARAGLGLDLTESSPLIFVRIERGMMPFMPAKAMVIGVPVGREHVLFGNVGPAAGAGFFSNPETDAVAILGAQAAAHFGATVGAPILVNGQSVQVIGVLEGSSMESVDLAAIMPLPAVQRIFGKEGVVSAVLLTPMDINAVDEIAATLQEDYPVLEVVTQDDMLAEAQEVMRMPLFYMSMMSVTAFVVAVAVIMSTMVMAVTERTREIGTLRAIGASKWLILTTILAESFILSLAGGIPGALLAVPMAAVMRSRLPTPLQLAQIVGFALVAALLGSLYPAWRVTRLHPIEALRYE